MRSPAASCKLQVTFACGKLQVSLDFSHREGGEREEVKSFGGYMILTTIVPRPHRPEVVRTCSGAVLEL